jgi:tuftelin-interacting protein 11
MGRRKRAWLDDDDSSDASDDSEGRPDIDANDPDARAEQELFADPYKRKRRRRNGKDDAFLGVFGDDDEDENSRPGPSASGQRPKYTKYVAFIDPTSRYGVIGYCL